jgi:hypothetical protein
MKTITNIIYPAFALSALACVAFLPQALATCQDACLTNDNTVQGNDALISLTTGTDNTGLGFQALFNNTTGIENTATGSNVLFSNTTGFDNTASGYSALYSNTIGYYNTAIGSQALYANTSGTGNNATGAFAMRANTTGSYNVADGQYALLYNTTGYQNTAVGEFALVANSTGGGNTAVGAAALVYGQRGSNNTAVGFGTFYNFFYGGSNNIAIGAGAGDQVEHGNNNIEIGNGGALTDSGVIRIGTEGIHTAIYLAGIRETPLSHGTAVAVGITPDGQLGVRASSARFEEAIKPMDKASEAILALQPVTFHYKKDLDPDGIPQFGLVAEEVEKVNPDLVARDDEGKPYTVRYEAVNAMLLNEFLKEHRKVEALEKQVEQLAAGLQKVSAQLATGRVRVVAGLELSKSLPQTVLNDQ